MATHSDNGGNYGRTFFIARENGQVAKDGRPYFFEWLRTAPPEKAPGRKFESRTNSAGEQKHYELFKGLSGFLIGVEIVVKSFDAVRQNERFVALRMIDQEEEYTVEIGRIDSRWSIDLMRRLLHNDFDPNKKIHIGPYIITENGDTKMGVSVLVLPDTKLTASYKEPHLAGQPEPTTREWKGKTEYDWIPVAEWLYAAVDTKVVPRLRKDPLTEPVRVPMPPPATAVPAAQPAPADHNDIDDDLPF